LLRLRLHGIGLFIHVSIEVEQGFLVVKASLLDGANLLDHSRCAFVVQPASSLEDGCARRGWGVVDPTGWFVCKCLYAGGSGTDRMEKEEGTGAGEQLHQRNPCIGEEGILSIGEHAGGKILHDRLSLNHKVVQHFVGPPASQ
jgi:hypothetical protein